MNPFTKIITQYVNAANAGDVDHMMECFCDDIVVYTNSFQPRSGRRDVARFLSDFVKSTGARWTIDRAVAQESEAVIEWSCLLVPPGEVEEVLMRGIDWFLLEEGKIKEIHEWGDPRMAPEPLDVSELQGFPYESRGYPTPRNLDSKLPN